MLTKRQNGLFRLMEHNLGCSGQFFETRGQWLHLDASNAGLCLGDPSEVGLESAQNRAGLADALGQIGESVLESFTAFAPVGMLLDLQIGQNSTPDTGPIPQFLDEVSGCIQEVGF